MILAYVDESGDRGPNGSRTYSLACVLIRPTRWKLAFDAIIGYRRFLKKTFGVHVRSEIKANHLLRNGGDFRDLALKEYACHFIYKGLITLQPKIGIRTFAIVINKAKLSPGVDPMLQSWVFLLQRLETLTRKDKEQVMIIHDEGEPDTIRQLARKARRFNAAGSLFGGSRILPLDGLIDDPVSRNSKHSYFLQLADLNAYAAFRRGFPPPPRKVPIVPETMWDELGDAQYGKANEKGGGPGRGIVLWPK